MMIRAVGVLVFLLGLALSVTAIMTPGTQILMSAVGGSLMGLSVGSILSGVL